jgi:hypothetical protein
LWCSYLFSDGGRNQAAAFQLFVTVQFELGGIAMKSTAPVNEVRYLMAHNFLSYLLEHGKITLKEFHIADQYAVEKYRPKLRII